MIAVLVFRNLALHWWEQVKQAANLEDVARFADR